MEPERGRWAQWTRAMEGLATEQPLKREIAGWRRKQALPPPPT